MLILITLSVCWMLCREVRLDIPQKKNINKIFGFVTAKVTAPSIEQLKVATLPYRDTKNNNILFRDTVIGSWFSEELKDAIKWGYKVEEIYSCIQFDKVYFTLDKFVNELHKEKEIATNNGNKAWRLIIKLVLNSLSGRLELKDQEHKVELVNLNDSKYIKEKYTSDIIYRFKNMGLIKKTGNISNEMKSLLINNLKKENRVEGNQVTGKVWNTIIPNKIKGL